MSTIFAAGHPDTRRPLWQETIALLAYPASLGFAITTFLWASAHGYPRWVSAYLPVIACAAVVLPCLERLTPFRTDWRPNRSEWFTDVLYIFLIQVAVPSLLALLLVLGLSHVSRPYLHFPLWPHAWSILAQGLLMVLLVDLMRYWLHRFAHTNPILWRLHAVHHSPNKLYWLNTARFHPLEKSLHFLFDSLPFILLGVNEYVLAFYFVCYSVNGFFQHSNVYLRLGPLSYVLSTAELHRWHHSKILAEANHNYSNTTIIWDWVFGTYYRPRDHQLGRVGITNDNYPMRIREQLLAPFVKHLESREVFLPTLGSIATNFLLRIGFAKIQFTYWRAVKNGAIDFAASQSRLLLDILQRNRETEFGKNHHFAKVKSVADFQRLCPVQTYDSLHGYIATQEQTGLPKLTADPVVSYARTSGTTGAAKLLPLTSPAIRQIRRQQAIAGFLQYRACPQAFQGALLGIGGALEEERSASGKPVGSISGLMYDMLPWAMRRKFVVPAIVFGFEDHLTKYLLILRLALSEKNLTYVATANPSTLVLLSDLLHRHRDELLSGLANGSWPSGRPLSSAVATAVQGKLKPNPARAKKLSALFATRERVLLGDIWPHLALIATWTGGNCRIPLNTLKRQLSEHIRIMDLGFLASECRVTLSLEADKSAGLPAFQDYFLEFVERDRWDEQQPVFMTLEQLSQGKEYFIFVTTGAGLYRYDLNDIVRVSGFWQGLPLLEFLQKGKGVTNITGEKLSETQLTQVLEDLAVQLNLGILFFIALADPTAAHYDIYVELQGSTALPKDLSEKVDTQLCQQNLEYQQKRASGRLHSARVWRLAPGTATQFRAHAVARGQKEGQFKLLCLAYKDDMTFDFQAQIAAQGDA